MDDHVRHFSDRYDDKDSWVYDYSATYNPFHCTEGRNTVPIEDMMSFWWNIRRNLGPVRISIGGDNSTKDLGLISFLSGIHYVVVSTDMSLDVDEYIDYVIRSRSILELCGDAESVERLRNAGYDVRRPKDYVYNGYEHDPNVRCLAGCKHFRLDPYGYIHRCCTESKIGNIYDPIDLTTLAEVCGKDECACWRIRDILQIGGNNGK